jgi:hypothetical protein
LNLTLAVGHYSFAKYLLQVRKIKYGKVVLKRSERRPGMGSPDLPSGPRVQSISLIKRRLPTPSVVFDTYWRFAVERQAMYFRRLKGQAAPWTEDRVLREHRFTNAYRASDRVSQYLIRHVLYRSDAGVRDTVLRALLFKIFNKIETWEFLQEALGEVGESTFSPSHINGLLMRALDSGASIYSAAYIMPSGPASIRQPRKHVMHLALLQDLLRDQLPERLAEAKGMAEAYRLLLALPSIGPFLAYQFATDLNYSSHFDWSEMEFVMPGPGARDGIRKCFSDLGDYSEADVIRWVSERQGEECAARGLNFKSLWGRPLQLIDCQNLFCEVDKYARVVHPEIAGRTGRMRIKQRFLAKGIVDVPWFPPKWGINDRIATDA